MLLAELNKCRNIRQIYQTLPQSWQEKLTHIVLTMWVLLPLPMLLMFFIFAHDVDRISVMYSVLIESAGNLTLMAMIIQFAEKFALRKKLEIMKLIKKAPWSILLLLMLVWVTIACLRSKDLDTAIYGIPYYREGLTTYIYYAAIYYQATKLTDEYRTSIIRRFVWVSLVLAIVFLAQYLHIGLISNTLFAGEFAFLNSTNYLGYYLALSIILLAGLVIQADRKGMFIYSLLLAFNSYTLIRNNTFGGFIAAVLALVLLIPIHRFYKKKFSFRLLIPLAIFLFVCLIHVSITLFTGNDNSIYMNIHTLTTDVTKIARNAEDAGMAGSGRFRLWAKAIELIREKPWFGYGPDQTVLAISPTVTHVRPHNELIQHALYFGIPAALLYLTSLIWILVRQVKQLSNLTPSTVIAAGAVIAYFISSMFGNTTPWVVPIFMMCLAFSSAPGSLH
ncbi:MAG: O-antigen ligase family protein [Bacillota bacterium]|nr:O-antigen ligase family protein [Bacillota bacterium]